MTISTAGLSSQSGCNIQGEQAVPQQAHGLEEANVAAQQIGVDRENGRPRSAHAKHKLHAKFEINSVPEFVKQHRC